MADYISTLVRDTAHPFDINHQLRDRAGAAISATTAETAINYTSVNDLCGFKVVVSSAAYTGYVATTAQWDVAIEVSANNSTFTQVALVPLKGSAGLFEVALTGKQIEDTVNGAAYIRARAVKTGTPGNLSYGAFISEL